MRRLAGSTFVRQWLFATACAVGLGGAISGESTAWADGSRAHAKPARDQGKSASSSKKSQRGSRASAKKTTAKRGVNATRDRGGAKKTAAAPRKCLHAPVEIERSELRESVKVSLTDCDGRPLLRAQEALSGLARKRGTRKPGREAIESAEGSGDRVSDGTALLDAGLLTRLQKIVDHFGGKKIDIVSGFRPQSDGSLHQRARALDLRVEGVTNEDVVEFCATLTDTGCGYYPNSSFVHVDVRPKGNGHTRWIDASGPGEKARYVSSWPPKSSAGSNVEASAEAPAPP